MKNSDLKIGSVEQKWPPKNIISIFFHRTGSMWSLQSEGEGQGFTSET